MIALDVEVSNISDVKLFSILNIGVKMPITIFMLFLTYDALLYRGFCLEELFQVLFRDRTLTIR